MRSLINKDNIKELIKNQVFCIGYIKYISEKCIEELINLTMKEWKLNREDAIKKLQFHIIDECFTYYKSSIPFYELERIEKIQYKYRSDVESELERM